MNTIPRTASILLATLGAIASGYAEGDLRDLIEHREHSELEMSIVYSNSIVIEGELIGISDEIIDLPDLLFPKDLINSGASYGVRKATIRADRLLYGGNSVVTDLRLNRIGVDHVELDVFVTVSKFQGREGDGKPVLESYKKVPEKELLYFILSPPNLLQGYRLLAYSPASEREALIGFLKNRLMKEKGIRDIFRIRTPEIFDE